MRALLCVFAAWLASPAWGQQARPFELMKLETLEIQVTQAGEAELRVYAVYFAGSGWERNTLEGAFRQSARILAQCGLRLTRVELALLEASRRVQYYFTPLSREFARSAAFPRPTVYFVRDSLNRPAFDAEAIGLSNSRTRPELANSIWVTLGTRDLGIALAHELVHLLTDSGEHVESPGNLMRADTAPENIRLDAAQCARILGSGRQSGLLH